MLRVLVVEPPQLFVEIKHRVSTATQIEHLRGTPESSPSQTKRVLLDYEIEQKLKAWDALLSMLNALQDATRFVHEIKHKATTPPTNDDQANVRRTLAPKSCASSAVRFVEDDVVLAAAPLRTTGALNSKL